MSTNPSQKSTLRAVFWVLFFAAGLGAGYLHGKARDRNCKAEMRSQRQAPETANFVARRLDGYELTHPMVACEPTGGESRALAPVRAALAAAIDEQRATGRAQDVSVYLADLESAEWLSIEADAKFAIASLSKVAWLMITLKSEQLVPGTIERRVEYPLGLGLNDSQTYQPKHVLDSGESYPLWRFVEVMITESDNDALIVLRHALRPSIAARVFGDLGLPELEQPEVHGGAVREFATPRTIGRMFQLLYDASYLGTEASEAALALLRDAHFKDGLVAGVPADVPVAHKFGQFSHGQSRAAAQLHDCGVVYLPGRPYTLCVMTRGPDTRVLAGVVAAVSRAAYESMSGARP